MRYNMTFLHFRKLSSLRYLIFRRRINTLEKWKNSRTLPTIRSFSMDSDSCHDPPPSGQDSCPPTYPETDPRKYAFWRMLSLYVALPVVVIMSAVTYIRVQKREKEPREPFLDIPYMYRRTKPFPWGDGNHTLFHNPAKNPVPPHGYEVEDPNAKIDAQEDN